MPIIKEVSFFTNASYYFFSKGTVSEKCDNFGMNFFLELKTSYKTFSSLEVFSVLSMGYII